MKKKYLALLTLLPCLALAACGGPATPPSGQLPPNEDPFENPGDNLGGGGTGEIADEIEDSSSSSSSKGEVQEKSDLEDLSQNTSSEGATVVDATEEIVEISKSGTYYFKGAYGGILFTKKDIDVHLVFDGVTISREDGIAIETDKKPASVIITLVDGSVNTVTNGGDDVNAIHVKAPLSINGKGTLNVVSNSKSALKSSGAICIVYATLNLTAKNHGVTGASIAAENCTVNVLAAGKDGINAECDAPEDGFTTADGFVSLKNVNYTCDVEGDGIQADTIVTIDGGNYDIKTNGTFVQKSTENMNKYGMTADDFKYIKSGNDYQKIASDETGRYGNNLYGLSQSCKGIKVGEIEYEDKETGKTVTVAGDYLIAVTGGTFNVDSTDDAIHANGGDVLIEGGTFEIATYDDAVTSDVLTKITGGDITITASYEGIEGSYVEISGGTIDLTASDDGINAASDDRNITPHIIISGGDVKVDASGDGIDSNGSILISGGTVIVYGPTTGADAGLDADKGIVITGGYVFATSTLGMVETPSSNSTQYVVSYAHQSTITAGSVISLLNDDGETLFSVEILKNCQSVIFSTPDLDMGGTYSLYGGDTQLTSFTISSIITTIGSSGSSFPGGRPGGATPPGGFGGFGGRR